MHVYVEHDEKIQIYFLKFSNNIEKFSMMKFSDLDVWVSSSKNYHSENPNQIYHMMMTQQAEADSQRQHLERDNEVEPKNIKQ
jgi:hypothetical protein